MDNINYEYYGENLNQPNFFQNVVTEIMEQYFDTPENLETFDRLSSDEQRVANILPLFANIILPTFQNDYKSEAEAVASRKWGNQHFQYFQNYVKASQAFSESIAHSPLASENLSLAYANRSAALKMLGLYENCLSDIAESLANNYPQRLHYKLLKRRGECQAKLGRNRDAVSSFLAAQENIRTNIVLSPSRKKIEEDSIYILKEASTANSHWVSDNENLYVVPPLIFGKNSEIPNASKGVALCFDDENGRFLEAIEEILPGSVVVVEKAYAASLFTSNRYSHCNYCLKRTLILIPCCKCSWAMFCSKECLEAGGSAHEIECVAVSKLDLLNCSDLGYLAVKTIASATTIEQISTFVSNLPYIENNRTVGFVNGQLLSNFNAIYSLRYLILHHTVYDLLKFSIQAVCIAKFVASHERDVIKLGGLILTLMMTFESVSCRMHDYAKGMDPFNEFMDPKEDIGVGLGAFACSHLIGHSCNPNIYSVIRENVEISYAIQTIPKGAKLTKSHMFLYHKVKNVKRTQFLYHSISSECYCQACRESWPIYKDLPLYPPVHQSSKLYVILVILNLMAASKSFFPRTFVYAKNFFTHQRCCLLDEVLLQKFNQCIAALDRHRGNKCRFYVDCQDYIMRYHQQKGRKYYTDVRLTICQ